MVAADTAIANRLETTRYQGGSPTLGQHPADARRIQLSGGALESDTALEFGEGILRTLNRLELVMSE